MARPRLIATTPRTGLRPLGAQGQTVAQAQQQITALIASRLTPRHGLLFAEPVADPARDSIAWYSTADGTAVLLAQASPEQQAAARHAIAELADGIKKLAAEYAAAANPQQRQLAQLLELAQSFPGEECVFLAGEQPIVIAWGHAPAATAATEPTSLTRYGVRRAAKPRAAGTDQLPAAAAAGVTAANGAQRGWRDAMRGPLWVLFLLLGLVVGSTIGWAIKSGPLPIVWTAGVPVVVSDPLADARATESRLRQEIADLSIQISQEQLQCVPPAQDQPPQSPSPAN